MSSNRSLYSSCGWDAYYGPSDALLSAATTDDTALVNHHVAQLLDECQAPRTVDEHVAHVSSKLHIEDRTTIKSILEGCIAEGLLQDIECSSAVAGKLGEAIATLVIPTCDRPEYLKRCVESYLSRFEEWSREVSLVIVDGSRTAVGASATESIARSVRQGCASVTYVGRSQREELRVRCKRAGFDPDVVAWLVPDPPSHYAAGAARNTALMATAGGRVLTADDDTICWMREHRERERGLAFVGHAEVRNTIWFCTRQDSIAGGLSSDVDLAVAHGAVLGTRLVDLRRCCPPVDLTQACKHLLRRLQGAEGARVRCCWLGVAGDGASYCPHGAIFSAGSTRDVLAKSPTLLGNALRSREVFRAPVRLSVTDETGVMCYCAALDNTQLLPPFSPTRFNEDGLFGWMLRACDPQAFISQLPYAIVHDSSRPSVYAHAGILSASQVRTSEIIVWLCRPWLASCANREISDRLQSLAIFLQVFGHMDREDFQAHLRTTVIEAKWECARRCEVIQKEFAYPPFWENVLLEYKLALIKSMMEPGFYIPIESKRSSSEEGLADLQHHLGMYGRALSIWPDLWEFCRTCDMTATWAA